MKPAIDSKWKTSDLAQMKRLVKSEIDSACSGKSNSERIKFILRRISELSKKQKEKDGLKLLIYCISALFHHSQKGGLDHHKIAKLEDLAFVIIRYSGVTPKKSKLSSLYGELYQVSGLIDRQNGRHWQAVWKQQLALYLSMEQTTESGQNYGIQYQHNKHVSTTYDFTLRLR